MDSTNAPPALTIEVVDAETLTVDWRDIDRFPATARIDDVSTRAAGRRGRAVRCGALLTACFPKADWAVDSEAIPSSVTLRLFGGGGYEHAIPLHLVSGDGMLLYAHDDGPLPVEWGGPFRFLVPDTPVCGTAPVDSCVNVKGLHRLRIETGE